MAEINLDAPVKEAEAPRPARKKKNVMVGGILLGVMLAEGLLVFFLVRHFSGGPVEALGGAVGGLNPEEGEKVKTDVEVEVARFRAQNERAQRMTIYEMSVFALVKEDQAAKFRAAQEARKNTIQDRFSSVIRASDPQRFIEPDLATLRDRFRQILSEVMGEEFEIQGVLIPEIVSFSDG